MTVGKEDAEYINKIYGEYNKAVSKYIDSPEFRKTYASKLMSDMGYEDTKEGRDYVLTILDEMINR